MRSRSRSRSVSKSVRSNSKYVWRTSRVTSLLTNLFTYSVQTLLFDDKERQERRNAGRRPSLKEVDKYAAAAI